MKRATCVLALAAVFCVAGTSQANIGDGLQNYWNFDSDLNDSAGGKLGNASTVDDNGTFTGPGASLGGGLFGGGGLLQNGNNDYVNVPASADISHLSGDLSISAWFKVDNFNHNWQALISNGEGSAYRIARRSSDQPGRMAYAGGVGDIPGEGIGPVVDDGGWHHVVAISEHGVSTRLWVDGGLVVTGGAPNIQDNGHNNEPNVPHALAIGNNIDRLNRGWEGEIDDVAIWDRPLTDDEIGLIWAGGQGESIDVLTIPEPSSLILAALGLFSLALCRWRRRRA